MAVSISQGFASPFKTQSLAITLDDVDVSITQVSPGPKNAIEYYGGAPGKLKDKSSYWHRLLSPPIQDKLDKLEPEVAEVIEAKAAAVVEKQYTQKEAQIEMRQAMDQLGFAYTQAYKRIYLELVSEMKQAQEDDQIAHIVAMLI